MDRRPVLVLVERDGGDLLRTELLEERLVRVRVRVRVRDRARVRVRVRARVRARVRLRLRVRVISLSAAWSRSSCRAPLLPKGSWLELGTHTPVSASGSEPMSRLERRPGLGSGSG